MAPAKISEKILVLENLLVELIVGKAASKVDNSNESSGGVDDADEFACRVDR